MLCQHMLSAASGAFGRLMALRHEFCVLAGLLLNSRGPTTSVCGCCFGVNLTD